MIFRNDYRDFDRYLRELEIKENDQNGLVPDSTFFCLDVEQSRFVGAVNIRHRLNDALRYDGGHIGYGIRPSERRKGYATAMLALALEKCRMLGLERVLVCCDKDNIASAKTIQHNGGILENEVSDETNTLVQRYWIEIS